MGRSKKKFSTLSAIIFVACTLFPNWNAYCVQEVVVAREAKLQNNLINIDSDHQPNIEKIILSFAHPVTYKTMSLSDPARLVIDFPDTRYAVQRPSGDLDLSDMGVIDVRHGIQEGYNLRLVFDLQKPRRYSVEVEKNTTEKMFQIAITFTSPVTHTSSLKTPALSSPPIKQYPVIKEDKTTITPSVSSRHQKFIVVIDAGHGGKDPGATGPQGTREKDVTLAIAKDLEVLVNAEPDMKAALTRSNDIYIGLRHRLMIARKAKGDVFVAIHADAYQDISATGASVYALSLHGSSSEAALWLSQKENYSELGGIDLGALETDDLQVRSVLIDLSQAANITASLHLGQDLLSQLGKITDLHHSCVEQAPFMVLKSPDIPSVLVETGFISNPNEENRLKTENYQQKLAKALLLGLKAYYEQYEKSELHCVNQRACNN